MMLRTKEVLTDEDLHSDKMLPNYAGQFDRTNQAACTGETLEAFLVEKVLMMMTCIEHAVRAVHVKGKRV